uniref:Zinc-finger domain-containing protein n=1 Tax=Oryza brachyantha TaxID=4533 RepID=J3LS51_ORYBR
MTVRLRYEQVPARALSLLGSLSKFAAEEAEEEEDGEEEKKAAGVIDKERVRILQERRCDSKGRGAVYDTVLGICCHFCRQKKLCGEEGCKRCGEGDLNQPCIGKTDCSSCHSSYGILCRGCLKVRYGEDMDEVRKNKNWMCPHCIEEKGIKQFWICNSSICLKKRKLSPTGIAIYDAREQGYESVAHLLMDKLKCRAF